MSRSEITERKRRAAASSAESAGAAAAQVAAPLKARAILVLGMHRSGTSALTRVFNLLGADLPKGLIPPGRDNELGYWEASEIVAVNDKILASAGSSWHDWRPFDATWRESSEAQVFRRRLVERLRNDFGSSALFVIKDPRICRLVPFWLDVLADLDVEPAIVMPIRNPVEVADSLQQRNGFVPAKSYLLWLRHVLAAEKSTRGLPRAVTTYDRLLDDWREVAADVAVRANLAWPRTSELAESEVNDFLASRLRHHAVEPAQLASVPDLVTWVRRTYTIMGRMAQSGDDQAGCEQLDRFAAAFDNASLAFGTLIEDSEKDKDEKRQNWLGLGGLWIGSAERETNDVAALQRQLAAAEEKCRRQENDLNATKADLAAARDELRRVRRAFESADKKFEETQATLREDANDLRDMRQAVAQSREELDRRDSEAAALRTELKILRALSGRVRGPAPSETSARGRGGWVSSLAAADWSIVTLWQARRMLQPATQMEAIRRSGLMDGDWYLERYPDVAAAGIEAVVHYVKRGVWEGRDPHPLFDTAWYKQTYPKAASQGLTPLAHYVTVGADKGYDPNPLFYTAWYVAQHPDAGTGGSNPLKHYMDHGAEPGCNPNPLFDTEWYVRENPEVEESGENPLCHYLRCGVVELRDPHPLFDTEWYLEQYKHVVAGGTDALEHYLTVGALEGCRPGPITDGERARRRTPRKARQGKQRGELGNVGDLAAADAAAPLPTDVMKWQLPLSGRAPAAPRFTGQIGVFVHLYYEDLAAEIAESLLNIPFDFKVYVSTNNNEKKAAIEAAFRQFKLEPVVKVVPNRGWDLAPLVVGFAEEIRQHEICLKLHGKKSTHNPPQFGNRWRRYLLSGLLGSPRNVGFIMGSFAAQPELGVFMLQHWKRIARGAAVVGTNFRAMQDVLQRVGLSLEPEQRIEFPSGSMFWFRSAALAPLLDLGLSWPEFYGCRSRHLDGTIAHGLERCILIFAAKAGFKWALPPRRWAGRSAPDKNRIWSLMRPRKPGRKMQ